MTKLLLVEDDPIIARSIPAQMTKYGYRVVGTARSGEEAVALAEKLAPDLVIMDVDLLGAMDGLAAAAEIQKNKYLPVLYTTSHAESERTEKARAAGPFTCLLKPLTERELAMGIELSLCRHASTLRLQAMTEELKKAKNLIKNPSE